MRNRATVRIGIALAAALFVNAAVAAGNGKKEETGKQIAFSRSQGNCLACHAMPTVPGAIQPGDIGPPLVGMSARFPNKQALFNQIWNPMANNPQTFMPPFGKHKILTKEQIDKVVDFIYGL